MATEQVGSLPVGDENTAEVTAEAVPTTSATTADKPTSGASLFEPLHDAKRSLMAQSEGPAQMHPLTASLQSLYSTASPDGRLSREQYRQLISQIRHSVSQFVASSPATRSQASAASSNVAQQPNDASIANQLRRYISLLTETSTHTAALTHSIDPFRSADRDSNGAFRQQDASILFPPQLQVGAMRVGASEEPTHRWQDAVETLEALCDRLEHIAKSLGLETFSEPSSEATAAPSDAHSSVLRHTLTLGAKILVIDLEFLIVKADPTPSFRPKIKLKLSYATDSADSQQTRDPRLGAVLQRDVQLIADKLFGPSTSSALQQDRALIAQALANWTTNLKDLLTLDDLEAQASQAAPAGSRTVNLFAAMQELCSAAVQIADEEASSSAPATLLDRGHGLHKLHETTPFLRAVIAHDPTSKQDYTLSLSVQALDLPAAESAVSDMATPSFPLSPAALHLLASAAASDPAKSLGSVPSPTDKEKRVPLQFVVRLSPPVVVTRPTAAKLASICNLKHSTPHSNATIAPGVVPKGAVWFEDVLASSWSGRAQLAANDNAHKPARCVFTLAQTVESVRSSESQGLVIDSLPLLAIPPASGDAMDESDTSRMKTSTLARLFAAIEVLRDEIKVTELMHSAIASSEQTLNSAAGQMGESELTLDDMLSTTSNNTMPKIPVTLAFRTPVQGAADEAGEMLSLELAFRLPAVNGAEVGFDASITPSKSTSETGWSLSANAKLVAPGESSSKSARLDSTSAEARAIVANLSDLESLEDVVLGLLDWAENQLGLRLEKPAASKATFDPLSYEQNNVHAIYETIAPHFSSTRYKPWPLIPAFLSTIPPGSLGADLGCGNGKYLPIRSTLGLVPGEQRLAQEGQVAKFENSLLTVGIDRSSNLISLARDNFGMSENCDAKEAKSASTAIPRRHEVAVGDAIQSSLRTGLFDYAISIATIHHFSTWERRRASVQELIRIVAPIDAGLLDGSFGGETCTDPRLANGHGCGRFMIFVWALEQKDEGKRQFQADDPGSLNNSREIHDPNHAKSKERLVSYSGLQATGQPIEADTRVTEDQDVLVPWVLTTTPKKTKPARAPKTKNRAGREVQTQTIEASMSELKVDSPQPGQTEAARPVYNRYYHMFRTGELESLVVDAAATMQPVHRRRGATHPDRVHVVREASGWERGNWWGVWRVQWAPPAK